MKTFFTKALRSSLAALDIDVRHRSHLPEATLAGLSRLPIRTVLDVGANTGQFAKIAAGNFPQARIHAFEPLPGPFAVLQRSVSANLVAYNIALGEAEGEAEMHSHLDHSASSSLLPATATTHEMYPLTQRAEMVKVRVTTLDRAVAELGIELRADVLVKLDVQGFEDRVIRGGRETLRRARACIVEANLAPLYEGQPTFRQLVELLGEAGLSYAGNLAQTCGSDGSIAFIDAVFVRVDAVSRP